MKKLILHIGSTKTGSSAIQSFLWTNRNALADYGVLYPDIGIASSAHHLLAASIHPNAWRMHADFFAEQDRAAVFEEFRQRLQQAASLTSADTILISSEYWWGRFHDRTFLEQTKRLIDGFDSRVLCYLRPQDEWLESTYCQRVKSGEVRTFREWLLANFEQGMAFCQYDVVLKQWENVVPADRIQVRTYEPEGATDSIRDLLDLLGIPQHNQLVQVSGGDNPSMIPRGIELMRLINLSPLSPSKKQKVCKSLTTNTQKKGIHARFHFLSADETIALQNRYQRGNDLVAERYGDSHRAPLFKTQPPKPGAWSSWQPPTIEECMPMLTKILAELVPE
jgi:hypothetical protein